MPLRRKGRRRFERIGSARPALWGRHFFSIVVRNAGIVSRPVRPARSSRTAMMPRRSYSPTGRPACCAKIFPASQPVQPERCCRSAVLPTSEWEWRWYPIGCVRLGKVVMPVCQNVRPTRWLWMWRRSSSPWRRGYVSDVECAKWSVKPSMTMWRSVSRLPAGVRRSIGDRFAKQLALDIHPAISYTYSVLRTRLLRGWAGSL